MEWYHVDCVQFSFYDTPFHESFPGIPNSVWVADSDKEANIGIMHIYSPSKTLKDACGNSITGHEYQRFHQNRWDINFCNVVGNVK